MDESTQKAVRRYIGERVKHARGVDGVPSAEALAKQLGWSRSKVANFESGRKEVTFVDLCAIAQVQGRPVTWYFEGAPGELADAIPLTGGDTPQGEGSQGESATITRRQARSVGRNLAAERHRAGLTQRELAERTGVGATTISGCEKGRQTTTVATLQKIADGLDVPLSWLLYGPNPGYPNQPNDGLALVA